jgi:hypothetical protein
MTPTKNPAAAMTLETLRTLAAAAESAAWEHADDPLLVGLERWGRMLAAADRTAALRVLVAAAQRGFDRIAERSAPALADVGFFGAEDDEILDGAAVQVQLARVAAWLDAPEATRAKVDEAYDRTRQLVVWDDDLMPAENESYFWYLDIGQLCCAAVLNSPTLSGEHGDYYGWPPEVCIARGLVVAVRGLRSYERSVEKNLALLFGDILES